MRCSGPLPGMLNLPVLSIRMYPMNWRQRTTKSMDRGCYCVCPIDSYSYLCLDKWAVVFFFDPFKLRYGSQCRVQQQQGPWIPWGLTFPCDQPNVHGRSWADNPVVRDYTQPFSFALFMRALGFNTEGLTLRRIAALTETASA